jgi:hypothetical protein
VLRAPGILAVHSRTEFLILNIYKAGQVTGLLTGHCHLRATASNWKWQTPTILKVAIITQKQLHMSYVCETIADLRCRRSGKHFIKLIGYYEIPLCEILCFVGGTGLLAD